MLVLLAAVAFLVQGCVPGLRADLAVLDQRVDEIGRRCDAGEDACRATAVGLTAVQSTVERTNVLLHDPAYRPCAPTAEGQTIDALRSELRMSRAAPAVA